MGLVRGWVLGGQLAVLQAPMFDGLLLDGSALGVDMPVAPEVGIGGRHIAQALVIALVVRGERIACNAFAQTCRAELRLRDLGHKEDLAVRSDGQVDVG